MKTATIKFRLSRKLRIFSCCCDYLSSFRLICCLAIVSKRSCLLDALTGARKCILAVVEQDPSNCSSKAPGVTRQHAIIVRAGPGQTHIEYFIFKFIEYKNLTFYLREAAVSQRLHPRHCSPSLMCGRSLGEVNMRSLEAFLAAL